MGNCCCKSDENVQPRQQHAEPASASPEPTYPETARPAEEAMEKEHAVVVTNPLVSAGQQQSRRSSARSTSESSPLAQSVRRLSSLRALAVVNAKETEKLASQVENAFNALVAAEIRQYEEEIDDGDAFLAPPSAEQQRNGSLSGGGEGEVAEEIFSPRSLSCSANHHPVLVDPQGVEEAAAALQKIVDESLELAEKFCSSTGSDPHALTAHHLHDRDPDEGAVRGGEGGDRRPSSGNAASSAIPTALIDVLAKSYLVSDSTSEKFAELHNQLSEVLQALRPEAPSPRRSLDQIKTQSFRESKRISVVLESNRESLEQIVAAQAALCAEGPLSSTSMRLGIIRAPMITLYAEPPEVTVLSVALLATESTAAAAVTLDALTSRVLRDVQKRVVVLVGAAGSGKSTFLRKLLRDQWESWDPSSRSMPERPVAFLVDLRGYIGTPNASSSMKTLIRDAIQTRFGVLTPQALEDLRKVRILLLVDAYGEYVSSRNSPQILSSESRRRRRSSTSDEAWSIGNGTDLREWPLVTLVLAARPEQMAFRSDSELCVERGKLQTIKKIFLLPLTESQRRECATRHSELDIGKHHTSQWYCDRLENTPGLSELSLNPFLLRMALEALDEILEESRAAMQRVVHLTDVVSAYCDKTLKTKKGVHIADRKSTAASSCSALASAFLSAGLYSCSKGDDPIWQALMFTHQESDLLTNPFLFHGGGNVCFRQDVFLAYFASVDDDLTRGDAESFLWRRLLSTSDVLLLHFLSRRAKKDASFSAFLFALVQRSRGLYNYREREDNDDDDDDAAAIEACVSTSAANALTIISASHNVVSNVDFSGIVAPGALLIHGSCTFFNCSFQSADLSFGVIGALQAVGCNFDHANMFGVRTITALASLPKATTSEAFEGHSDGVLSLTQSPTAANVILSCSTDGALCFWNIQTGSLIRRIHPAHEGGVQACRFCETDERVLVTWGAVDGLVRMWLIPNNILIPNTPAATLLRTFSTVSNESPLMLIFASFDAESNTVTARCGDGTRLVWDAATCAVINRSDGDGDYLTKRRQSSSQIEEQTFFQASRSSASVQWTKGKSLIRLDRPVLLEPGGRHCSVVNPFSSVFEPNGNNKAADASVMSVALSDDGEMLAVLFSDQNISVFEFAARGNEAEAALKLVSTFVAAKEGSVVVGLTMNSDKTRIATFDLSGVVCVFHLDLITMNAPDGIEENKCAANKSPAAFALQVHHGPVHSAVFSSADPSILITGGADKTVRAWNVDTKELLWSKSAVEPTLPLLIGCSFNDGRFSSMAAKHLGCPQ